MNHDSAPRPQRYHFAKPSVDGTIIILQIISTETDHDNAVYNLHTQVGVTFIASELFAEKNGLKEDFSVEYFVCIKKA